MQGLMQDYPLVVTNILDYAARVHGDQQVVTCTAQGTSHRYSYIDMNTRSKQCALALQQLGVRPGSLVAILAFNSYRHMECWYGIMGLGAVCHSLNVRLFEAELEYIINHAEDDYIMLDPVFVPLMAFLQSKLPTVKGFIILTDRQGMPRHSKLRNMLCYEDLLQAQAANLPFEWPLEDENLAAGLCYTSGTTGKPKGVLYSHRSHFLAALAVMCKDIFNFGTSSRFLCVVPMFHANAWGVVFAAPMAGASLVLPGPRLDGGSVYEALEHFQCNGTAGVPTIFMNLLEHMAAENKALTHLKLIQIGGAACPPMLMERFSSMGILVKHAWGMTEISTMGSCCSVKGSQGSLSKEEELHCRHSQGWPHVLSELRIVNPDGHELPHDGRTTGELQIRGPQVVKTYFKAKQSAVDKDGWFSTGDVASIDSLGFMRITDRMKDVIKSGGEWISSIEVENIALAHEQVAEAAVIAVPHPKWTERPLLIVVPVEGTHPTAADILSFLKGKIANWWIPDDVVFVKSIPHTATGKIYKVQLRHMFQHYRTREASKL